MKTFTSVQNPGNKKNASLKQVSIATRCSVLKERNSPALSHPVFFLINRLG